MYSIVLCFIASQMWLLGRLLPLMVGDHVPSNDVNWLCFIDLLRILTIATAFEVTQDSVSILILLIEGYLQQFNQHQNTNNTKNALYATSATTNIPVSDFEYTNFVLLLH